MERTRPDVDCTWAGEFGQAFAQFASGLVGKRYCENFVRLSAAVGQQTPDSVDENSRFSASRGSENKERSFTVVDGLCLALIELHRTGCDAARATGNGQGAVLVPAAGSSIPQRVAAYIRKDAPYRAAKRAGLRSRAAPKLQELDQRHRFMRAGMRVLDLGCWPGGWLQIASRAVGPSGRVVGVDLELVVDLGLDNVSVFVGDVLDPSTRRILAEALGGRADIVLSDLAPKLSGVKVADCERHLRLLELAVDLAAEFLVDDGALVIKLFSGVESEATALLEQRIGRVVKSRPDSTRKGSSEIYAIAYKRTKATD